MKGKQVDLTASPNFIKMAPFGSRVVGCAKEDSDYDYLVLVHNRPHTDDPMVMGFEPDSGDPLYGRFFSSWRRDNVNLVFTDSEGFFNATLEAVDFCTKYKVFDKADRCRLHEAFREHLVIKDSMWSC